MNSPLSRRSCAIALTTSLVLAAPAAAQFATYTIVGTSCTSGRLNPAIGPVPFAVHGTPRLGRSFSIETESSASYPWGPRRTAVLLTGANNTSAGGVPLPFDIATLSTPSYPLCGVLRTSMDVLTRVPDDPDYRQNVEIEIAVPNSPTLLGAAFYQQVLSREFSTFGPPFAAVALSAAGHGVIGR